MIELRTELNEKSGNEKTLRESMIEIEKRCVKHRKQEVEAKRQLTHYEDIIVSTFVCFFKFIIYPCDFLFRLIERFERRNYEFKTTFD